MGYVGRNNIYEATIKRMVTQALEKQEQEFLEAHSTDADEQLLAYLRQSAVRLGHTPWPKEIVGGSFIEQRFGSWQNALQKAQLPMPSTFGKVTGFARYQAETERQKVLYREKKAAKKLRAKQRLAEQAKKKQPV